MATIEIQTWQIYFAVMIMGFFQGLSQAIANYFFKKTIEKQFEKLRKILKRKRNG